MTVVIFGGRQSLSLNADPQLLAPVQLQGCGRTGANKFWGPLVQYRGDTGPQTAARKMRKSSVKFGGAAPRP